MLWVSDEAQEAAEERGVRRRVLAPFLWAPEHFGGGRCLSFGREKLHKEA